MTQHQNDFSFSWGSFPVTVRTPPRSLEVLGPARDVALQNSDLLL